MRIESIANFIFEHNTAGVSRRIDKIFAQREKRRYPDRKVVGRFIFGDPIIKIEKTRSELVGLGLPSETVKIFSNLEEVIPLTALAACEPVVSPCLESLTPWEKSMFGKCTEIKNIPKIAIVDFDEVVASVHPALEHFWGSLKNGSPLSWKTMRSSIETTAPDFNNLLALRKIGNRVDKLFLWSSRFSPDEENKEFWRLWPLFKTSRSISCFPFFTKQEAERVGKSLCPGKTEVICGFKGISPLGFETIITTIEKQDPYVIYVGSSPLDLNRFRAIINRLRRDAVPFDRIVCCNNGHSIL